MSPKTLVTRAGGVAVLLASPFIGIGFGRLTYLGIDAFSSWVGIDAENTESLAIRIGGCAGVILFFLAVMFGVNQCIKDRSP